MTWNRKGIKGLIDKIIEVYFWCWYGITDKVKLYFARKSPSKYSGLYPLISIIMPTLGRNAKKAIESVINQTYQNWELIIIGDGTCPFYSGCSDGRIFEWNIPKKIHYPDKPIYHWVVGPVNAINFGLSKVRGDWIARIDDDDEWVPDHLSILLTCVRQAKKEFISSAIILDDKKPTPYNFYGKTFGAVQTWLYRSYLKCFKCGKQSWRWRPGVNDVALVKRMARAGVNALYLSDYVGAKIKPRPGLKNVGLKGWLEEHGS